MDKIPLYVVDAFCDRPFSGNPAGVCLLEGASSAVPDAWMKSVAAEMKHSETAFLYPEGDGFRLRWFTPEEEMDLCGHATLASAHILFSTGRVSQDTVIKFWTRSGTLLASQQNGWIELDFPVLPVKPTDPPAGLLSNLGLNRANFVGIAKFDYFVEVEEDYPLGDLKPDFRALKAMDGRGVIVTRRSKAGSEYDFISRFFAPQVGIDEDPVTGSAHCVLTPYWSQKLGKTDMLAYQASPRGGRLRVGMRGERVKIAGQAVTIFKAEMAESSLYPVTSGEESNE